MPYSVLRSPACIAQQVDNFITPKLFVMSGTDTIDIVTQIGYVTNGQNLDMAVGDFVLYGLINSPPTGYICMVTSWNVNGSVNLGVIISGTTPTPGSSRWATGTGEAVVSGTGESIIL